MKKYFFDLPLFLVGVIVLLFAVGGLTTSASTFHCGDMDWKTEGSATYCAPAGKTIDEVFVKAGPQCHPIGTCYKTEFNADRTCVTVTKVDDPGCKDISHIEGTWREDEPTSTKTEISTETSTATQEETETHMTRHYGEAVRGVLRASSPPKRKTAFRRSRCWSG